MASSDQTKNFRESPGRWRAIPCPHPTATKRRTEA